MFTDDSRLLDDAYLRYWLIDTLVKQRPYQSPEMHIEQSEKYFNYIRQTKQFAPLKEIK